MKPLYERQFIDTMIRGTLGMLNDKQRMTNREGALQFILESTGAKTEDEIRPIMKTMSCEDTMKINVGMSQFIQNYFNMK